ncbi:hypothetical protein FF041_24040 [Streptomyces jumonjinensis]|uniref:GIY-YIG domain-containing protein n=1 Tax=Streptomyces jumonjinensis TaxID=1945 RepID=A0A646KM78_STRJU|nr:hypothetical protein [Streptomyces jumonjinensis]
MSSSQSEVRRTAVYRLFDSGDQLLYVGVAHDPKMRFRQHRREKWWWPQVAVREVEWFTDRAGALAAEEWAIERERPRYNEAGVQWPVYLLGEVPAATMTMTEFRSDPISTIDAIAGGGPPVVLTRKQRPLVVLVPYSEQLKRPTERDPSATGPESAQSGEDLAGDRRRDGGALHPRSADRQGAAR